MDKEAPKATPPPATAQNAQNVPQNTVIRAWRFVPATGNSESRPFTQEQFDALNPTEGWTRVDEDTKK